MSDTDTLPANVADVEEAMRDEAGAFGKARHLGEHDVRLEARRLIHAIRLPDDGGRAAPRDIGGELQAMTTLTPACQKSAARPDLAAVESDVCQ